MRFAGAVYRALNPVWAAQPLSGEGAARFGGRSNPKGFDALYTALSPVTAMKEANQAGSFQPITLIACNADIDPVFDARDPAILATRGLTPADLARSDWREDMRTRGIAPTQQLALDLIGQGYHGLLAPSYAPSATINCVNLVLWNWSDATPTLLGLIDDDDRLRTK